LSNKNKKLEKINLNNEFGEINHMYKELQMLKEENNELKMIYNNEEERKKRRYSSSSMRNKKYSNLLLTERESYSPNKSKDALFRSMNSHNIKSEKASAIKYTSVSMYK
jgi:hypothetical protein